MSNNDPRLERLIERLSALTEAGKIEWKEIGANGTFFASFSGHSVNISARQSRMDPNQSEYFLGILDEWGELIEEVGDEDFPESEGRIYRLMRETYERARRTARGIDDALDKLLRELDGLG